MNKTELISEVATQVEMSKVNTEAVVDAVFQTIIDAVASNKEVSIAGFGKFEKVHHDASKRRNPKTQEPVDVPATDVPKFKPAKAFKEQTK